MKKLYSLALFALCFSLKTMAQAPSLTILHTNDTHSCIYPLNPNLADTMMANRGGFIRRIALLKQERTLEPTLLLFDSGDFSQGSSFYTLFKGEVEIKLMNEMGYDAATIGNHEFDFGLENMAKRFRQATFPIVCSNLDFSATPVKGLVKPYHIIIRNGIRIGIFGLSPVLEGLVEAKNYKGVKYLDPIETALKITTFLKKEKKCDVIICLSHLGWTEEGINDRYFIPRSCHIDLLLGGHSHTYMTQLMYANDLNNQPVAVDQNGKSGVFIGKIKLNFKKSK